MVAANVARCRTPKTHPNLIMACAEEERLRQNHNEALRAWRLNHSGRVNGVDSVGSSLPVRKQLLGARLKAANDLHDHAVACPSCRTSRIHLIDDD
jgi:hypothetical protein